MKKLFLFILLLFSGTTHAAELCDAGYYINTETGECAQCGDGRYYCPGDNIRYNCPELSTNLLQTWPEDYHNPTIYRYYADTSNPLRTSANSCRMYYELSNKYGLLYDLRSYNPITDLYETATGIWGWMQPYAGHYLYGPRACWAAAYYNNAAICPAGAYCPGKEIHYTCTNYTMPKTYGLYVCGDNSYSDAGASTCTPCPIGTGNSGDDITDHAGIESCAPLPLCTAGAKLLHVGNTAFNIWPNDKCTSPAVRVQLEHGICCVNLEPGAGAGLNIRLNGNIYHTIN